MAQHLKPRLFPHLLMSVLVVGCQAMSPVPAVVGNAGTVAQATPLPAVAALSDEAILAAFTDNDAPVTVAVEFPLAALGTLQAELKGKALLSGLGATGDLTAEDFEAMKVLIDGQQVDPELREFSPATIGQDGTVRTTMTVYELTGADLATLLDAQAEAFVTTVMALADEEDELRVAAGVTAEAFRTTLAQSRFGIAADAKPKKGKSSSKTPEEMAAYYAAREAAAIERKIRDEAAAIARDRKEAALLMPTPAPTPKPKGKTSSKTPEEMAAYEAARAASALEREIRDAALTKSDPPPRGKGKGVGSGVHIEAKTVNATATGETNALLIMRSALQEKAAAATLAAEKAVIATMQLNVHERLQALLAAAQRAKAAQAGTPPGEVPSASSLNHTATNLRIETPNQSVVMETIVNRPDTLSDETRALSLSMMTTAVALITRQLESEGNVAGTLDPQVVLFVAERLAVAAGNTNGTPMFINADVAAAIKLAADATSTRVAGSAPPAAGGGGGGGGGGGQPVYQPLPQVIGTAL